MDLSRFIMALQWERAAVSLSVFLDAKSGKTTDLAREYARTDKALMSVKWRVFGPEKVFENPLRFQIRIDDFRFIYTYYRNILNHTMSMIYIYITIYIIGKRLPISTRPALIHQ